MSKMSRRMKFAHRMRRRRVIDRIGRENRHKAGYVGVAFGLSINGKRVSTGPGAVFMQARP